MLTEKWLSKQDDCTISSDGHCCSWEKDGKYFYYDDNGCWETSELIDVRDFTVKGDETYYGDEIISDFFDRVILDEVDFEEIFGEEEA